MCASACRHLCAQDVTQESARPDQFDMELVTEIKFRNMSKVNYKIDKLPPSVVAWAMSAPMCTPNPENVLATIDGSMCKFSNLGDVSAPMCIHNPENMVAM